MRKRKNGETQNMGSVVLTALFEKLFEKTPLIKKNPEKVFHPR